MTVYSLQHSLFAMTIVLFCLGNQGCGSVGPPIAPEEVGIKATVMEQQSKKVDSPPQDSEDEQEVVPLEDEEPVLPPLRPIGTR